MKSSKLLQRLERRSYKTKFSLQIYLSALSLRHQNRLPFHLFMWWPIGRAAFSAKHVAWTAGVNHYRLCLPCQGWILVSCTDYWAKVIIPASYIPWLCPVAFCWKLWTENSGPPVLGPVIQLILFQIPYTDGWWRCHDTLNHDASTHLPNRVPVVWVLMGSVIMAFLALLQPGGYFADRTMLFA